MNPLVYVAVLEQWLRDLHERSMGITSEHLAELQQHEDAFQHQGTIAVRDGMIRAAAIVDVIQMIRKSEGVVSLFDPDKTPVVDRAEDDTEPDGKIVPPKSKQH